MKTCDDRHTQIEGCVSQDEAQSRWCQVIIRHGSYVGAESPTVSEGRRRAQGEWTRRRLSEDGLNIYYPVTNIETCGRETAITFGTYV